MADGQQPINCFVGVFDILGFKALREKRGTDRLYQQFLYGIAPSIRHAAAGQRKIETVNGTQKYVPDFSSASVSYRAISDTVIFFTKDDSFNSFMNLVNSSFMLLQTGFNGMEAPFRGAIGWGDLIDDNLNGILVGSAIEDAEAGEKSQAWAGAMLTARCRDFAKTNNYIERYKSTHIQQVANESNNETQKHNALLNAKRLVAYPVPIQSNPKDGPATYSELDTYVVDWTIRMFEDAAEKSFDQSSSAHATTIARNTIAFENWARANNQ